MKEAFPRHSMRSRVLSIFPSRNEWVENRIALILGAVSGLCGAFVFADFSAWWLVWFALIPYFVALPTLSRKMVAWTTIVFAGTWQYASLFWLNTLVFFNPFIPLAIPLLALVLAFFLLIFAYPAAYIMRRWPVAPAGLAVAALWVGVEYARSFGDIAFPWNFLGHSQAPIVSFIQSADIWGVYGVSFLIVAVNAFIAGSIACRQKKATAQEHRLNLLFGTLLIALLSFSFFIYPRLVHIPTETGAPPAAESLRFSLIQPNISQIDKWNAYDPATSDARRMEIELEMTERHFTLMQSAWQTTATPQLYILPEAAFISPYFVYDTRLHVVMGEVAHNLQADILFGADRRETLTDYRHRIRSAPNTPGRDWHLPQLVSGLAPDGTTQSMESGPMANFTSAWLASAHDGLTSSVYDKIRLVPFGETAPILGAIPGLQEKIMMVGSFQPGLDQTMFETSGTKYGAMICFESTFATLGRGIARQGGDFIAVITNDAWYSPDYAIARGGFFAGLFRLPLLSALARSGPRQHFVQSIFRAVETRLPVLRSANTGISAVIAPSGRVLDSLPFQQEGHLSGSLPPSWPHRPSLYVRYGDWFGASCLVFLTLALLHLIYVWRRKP